MVNFLLYDKKSDSWPVFIGEDKWDSDWDQVQEYWAIGLISDQTKQEYNHFVPPIFWPQMQFLQKIIQSFGNLIGFS